MVLFGVCCKPWQVSCFLKTCWLPNTQICFLWKLQGRGKIQTGRWLVTVRFPHKQVKHRDASWCVDRTVEPFNVSLSLIYVRLPQRPQAPASPACSDICCCVTGDVLPRDAASWICRWTLWNCFENSTPSIQNVSGAFSSFVNLKQVERCFFNSALLWWSLMACGSHRIWSYLRCLLPEIFLTQINQLAAFLCWVSNGPLIIPRRTLVPATALTI